MFALILGMVLGLFLAFRPYLFIDDEMPSEKLARYKDF